MWGKISPWATPPAPPPGGTPRATLARKTVRPSGWRIEVAPPRRPLATACENPDAAAWAVWLTSLGLNSGAGSLNIKLYLDKT